MNRIPVWLRWVLAGFVILVVIGLAIGPDEKDDEGTSNAAAVATTSTEKATTTTVERTTTTKRPTTTTTEPPTTTTTVDPATVMKLQVAVWWNSEGQDVTDRFVEINTDISSAGEDGDISAMNNACTDMRDLAGQALDQTVPDPELDSEWTAAFTSYQQAGTFCVLGTDTINASLIERAAALMGEGAGHVRTLTGIVSTKYVP